MKILIINGHPDKESYNYAIFESYKKGAVDSDAEVKEIRIGELNFNPNLQFGYRKRTELEPDLLAAQEKIKWADHLVWIYPVWWGVRACYDERFYRPGFSTGLCFQEKRKLRLVG